MTYPPHRPVPRKRHPSKPDPRVLLAREYAEKGITVNNIPPGFVDTPMLRASPVDVDAQAAASPMKRAGRPEDIATACSYLVSEAACYVTGHTLGVNGGRVMP